jgi:HSP20 family protein
VIDVIRTRANPLQDFMPLWNVMDRFITDSFGDQNGWSAWNQGGLRSLPLEVYETPDQFVVRAVTPGVHPDNLTVEYDAGALTIRAKTEAPQLQEGWKAHLTEFGYGESVRQLRLPRKIDIDGAKSTFEHGVLTLMLPKVADARPHRIAIQTPAQLETGKTEG